MCLQTIFRGKRKKEYLAKLPDEITVWKVVRKFYNGFRTDCEGFPLHAGEVKFKQNIIHRPTFTSNYRGGGHFFETRAGARQWHECVSDEHVIKCVIKKEWINTVGEQKRFVVLVVKKAVFPSSMK